MGRSEQDILKILEIYEPSDKNATKASALLAEQGIKIRTTQIIKYWRGANLEIRAQGGRNRDGNIRHEIPFDRDAYLAEYADIVKAYDRYEGSATLARKSMGYSTTLIRRVWEITGKPIKSGRG